MYDSDNSTDSFPRSHERFDWFRIDEEENLRTLDLSALNLNLQFVEYLYAVVRMFWMTTGVRAMQDISSASVGLELAML